MHGDALSLADQVFLFKRTVREAALRHNMYATFMAKPMETNRAMRAPEHRRRGNGPEPVHVTGNRRRDVDVLQFLAGLQKYTPR